MVKENEDVATVGDLVHSATAFRLSGILFSCILQRKDGGYFWKRINDDEYNLFPIITEKGILSYVVCFNKS